jgi:hypothetical protein
MGMTLDRLDVLHTPHGQAALELATHLRPTKATWLAVLSRLRKQYDATLAQDALEQAFLRTKALAMFPNATAMYFTPELLEMATHPAVSRYRATRFRGLSAMADLCCGLGADALTLAAVADARTVFAVDNNPVAVALTKWNAQACGVGHAVQVTCADARHWQWPDVQAVFCDPARRVEGKRYLSVHGYQPNPSEVLARLPADVPCAFKLAPGLDRTELAQFRGELEFIHAEGELKEAVLWCGAWATAPRRATVLHGDVVQTMSGEPGYPADDLHPIGRYWLDPNAAVVRAELVQLLCDEHSVAPVDATVHCLTADAEVLSPFWQTYHVHTVLPPDGKQVHRALRQHAVGRITLLNRGSTLDLASWQKALKLSGSQHAYLIFTRELGRQVVLIADRVDA